MMGFCKILDLVGKKGEMSIVSINKKSSVKMTTCSPLSCE